MSCFKAAGLSGTFWRSHGIMCHGGYSSTSVVMCMALSVAGRSRPRHNGYTVPLVDRTCMALIEAERLSPREICCTSRNSCIASRRRRRGELLSVSSFLLRYSCAWPRPCRSMWSRRSASSIACHSREHRGDHSSHHTLAPAGGALHKILERRAHSSLGFGLDMASATRMILAACTCVGLQMRISARKACNKCELTCKVPHKPLRLPDSNSSNTDYAGCVLVVAVHNPQMLAPGAEEVPGARTCLKSREAGPIFWPCCCCMACCSPNRVTVSASALP